MGTGTPLDRKTSAEAGGSAVASGSPHELAVAILLDNAAPIFQNQ